MHSALNGRIDEHKNTPLMQAIMQGNVDQAKKLIEKNRFIQECNDLGQNALMIAVRYKQHELVRLLVQAGAEINCIDVEGNLAVDFLCGFGVEDSQGRQNCLTLKMLIDYGLLVCVASYEWTPLMRACYYGETNQVKLLLEQRANPNVCTSKGVTALLCAIQRREAQIVELLLKNGAQIDTDVHYSFDVLAWATLYGNASIVRSLLSCTKQVSACDIKRAYELAVLLGNVSLSKMFREYFPEIKQEQLAEQENGGIASDSIARLEAFDRAVANNDIAMVRTSMIDRIDQLKINQAVFKALRTSNEMISFLVSHHADINSIDDQGCTPLMIACKNLDAWMVRSLLANGANPSLIINGSTALLCAIEVSRLGEINGKDVSGNASLVAYQIQIRQNEIIPLLLNCGAQPNIKNRKGFTALMEAVKNGYNNVIPLLLNAGADRELVDSEGNTALHHACMAGNENAVRILLSFGALPSKTNRFGDTPARSLYGNEKIDAVLKARMVGLLKKYSTK